MFVVELINGAYRKQFRFVSLKSARKAAKAKLSNQLFYAFANVTGDGINELYAKSNDPQCPDGARHIEVPSRQGSALHRPTQPIRHQH